MKKIIPLALLILSAFQTFSQDKEPKPENPPLTNNLSPNATHQSKTNIVPPNPDAAALGKYGDVPVSLYTGTPNINIPLYTINRVVDVPISLSYHASGVKVDDISSMVGLGWVLNAGGVITRTVHGLPDDLTGGLQTTVARTKFNQYRLNQMNTSERRAYENDVMIGVYDTEPDEYYYNFLGRTGKMFFDENGNIILSRHEKLLVTKTSNGFTITDEVGTKYDFTEKETTKPTTYCFDKSISYTAESAWYLSLITPLNGRSIIFSYITRDNITYTQGLNQTNRYYISPDTHCPDDIQSPCKSVYRATVKQLEKITFDLGEVNFTYEQRGDLGFGWYRLQSFEVRNTANSLIKKYNFTYLYNTVPLGTQPQRYVLQKVEDITDSNITGISHTMEYNHFDDLPDRNSGAQDHWGYYNNNTSGNLIPEIPLSRTFPWANREPDAEKSQYGILSKITYPTGGSSVFVYEAHDFGYDKVAPGINLVENTGGVRIKTITHTDGVNPNQVRRYTYRMNDNPLRSSGCLVGKPLYYYDLSETKYIPVSNVEYVTANCSFRIASSSSQAYLGNTQGSHVGYEEVTEFFEEGTALNGKTWHKFTSFRDFPDYGYPEAIPFPPATSYDEARGQQKESRVYKYDNGNFIMLKKTVNAYNFTEVAEILGLKLMRTYMEYYVGGAVLNQTMAQASYNYKKIWSSLAETNEYSYDDNGNNEVHSRQTYQYSPIHLQIQETQTKHSLSNRTEITRYTYPLDYNTSGGSLDANATAIKDMQDKNVVRNIIETQNIIKENSVEKLHNATLNTYFASTTLAKESYSFISPAGESSWTNSSISGGNFQRDSRYSKDISFDRYDTYGNLLQFTPKNGIVESYVWGYSSKLPIIKAVGIPYSSITSIFAFPNILSTDTDIDNFAQQVRNITEEVHVYTHEPLRGVKRITAPTGINQYFEYDNLSRLKRVKDQDLNLTNWFNYAYATSSPGCVPPEAPSITVTSSALCSIDITASGCSGTVNWSNGGTGTLRTVSTTNTINLTATCTVNGCTSGPSNSLTLPSLPNDWISSDIGSPSTAGCTQLNGGSLSLQGSGNVGGTSDSFHWIAKQMSGDVTIIAKISYMSANDGMRAGIMLRNNTNANAQFYTLIQDGNGNVGELKRDIDGDTGGLYSFAPSAVNSTWIKVVKTVNSIKGYYSTNTNPEVNNAWNDYFNLTADNPTVMDLGGDFYVGFISYYPSYHNVIFTNITVNGNPL